MYRLRWQGTALTLLCVVAGCYRSHSRSGDAAGVEDAGPRPTESGVGDGGFADGGEIGPACPERLAAPCLRLREIGAWEWEVPGGPTSSPDVHVHGIGLRDDAAYVMASAAASEPGPERYLPMLVPISGSTVGDPVVLDREPTHYGVETAMGIASSPDRGGDVWAAWRYVVRSDPGGPIDERELVAVTAARDGIGSPQIVDRADGAGPDARIESGVAVLVRPDGEPWIVSADSDGVLLRAADGSRETTLASGPSGGPVRLVALSDGAAVLWYEPGARSISAAHLALVAPDMVVTDRRIVFTGERLGTALLGVRDAIYAAFFERNDADLRASRIRILHFDRALRRVEPDRTFGGWGGLVPSGLGLVMFDDEPWLVWQTIDARLDPHDALFALPLGGLACAGVVDAPSALAAGLPTVALDSFAVAADGVRLWIARVEGNASTDRTRRLVVSTAQRCGT